MTTFPFSYWHLLLISLAALAFFVAVFLFRRRWNTRPTRLRLLLGQPSDELESRQRLVPILIFEDQFPAFCEILGLVFERFPIERFDRSPDFHRALHYVSESAFQQVDARHLKAAMCEVVRLFLDDPDVEYNCRPLLSVLVDQFLREIEAEDHAA